MYSVEISNGGTGVFSVKARANEMAIEPMSEGFSPAEVLLASLGACMGYFVRRYIEQSKLGIDSFAIRLESDFSKRKKVLFEQPLALNDIKVSVDLKGAKLDACRRDALARYIRHCPIKATLEGRPEIKVEIV